MRDMMRERLRQFTVRISELAGFRPSGGTASQSGDVAKALQERDPAIRTRALDSLIAFPSFEHMYLLTYLQLADQKASVFVAITSGAIAYIVAHYGLSWVALEHISWHLALIPLATILLGISAAYAIRAIVPRAGPPRRGIIHFRDVGAHASCQSYADEVLSKSAEDLYEEQMAYCHYLARVCALKYQLLHRSLLAGALGYGAFLMILLIL